MVCADPDRPGQAIASLVSCRRAAHPPVQDRRGSPEFRLEEGVVNSGLYVNLDRCRSRREALLASLQRAGLRPQSYHRLPAIEPTGEEPELSRGLKTKGTLGIWQSMILALQTIAEGDFAPVVHVLEDDVCMAPGASRVLSRLTQSLIDDHRFTGIDVIYLDYLLNRNLFAAIVDFRERNASRPEALFCLPAHRHYLACNSSFLIRRSSAAFLAATLRRILASSVRLHPIDLTIRSLLRLGVLRGLLLLPPQGAPSWEQDRQSTIQTDADAEVRNSQRAYVLLRILASGQASPRWCADQLSLLYGTAHSLDDNAAPGEFLAFFDALRPAMAPFG